MDPRKTDLSPARQFLAGTIGIFAAEALLVPTSILTAAYLSRRFGAGGYGLLTLATVFVVWLQSSVAMALARPAIKLVSDARGEWHPVGASVLRLYLLVGCTAGLILWTHANPLAALMGEPALAGYFRLMVIDLPLFCAAQAHRNIIVGLGHFNSRAFVSASRWIARLVLVVIFVEVSGSASGAIWGSICASLVELLVCRFYVQPRLFERQAVPLSRLCGYALPLIGAAICTGLYSRLDLVMLKALGGTASDAGIYGVAQNLALLPLLLSFALAPTLLQTLTHTLQDGREIAARHLASQAIRGVLLLCPFAAIVAGCAPEIITLIFGANFLAASMALRVLIFANVALLMIAVTTSIMTAAGKRGWVLQIAWPPLVCAAIAHLVLIPLGGAKAAAWVTTVTSGAAAVVSIELVRRLWHNTPCVRSWLRSLLVCTFTYLLMASVPVAGHPLLLVAKLSCAAVFVPVAFWLLGEFSANAISAARQTFKSQMRTIEATGQL